MANHNPSIPRLAQQPLTIDFIFNRLPKHHPMFGSSQVQYSSASGQYAPISPIPVQQRPVGAGGVFHIPTPPKNDIAIQPRPAWRDTKVMHFWNQIFPESMNTFKLTPSPKGRELTPYNIRDQRGWDGVYEKLQQAQEKYQQDGGRVGWFRKARRKAADNITPLAETARIASKMAPSTPLTTPVLGTLVVIFDAVKNAAAVRNQVLQAFDGLIPTFSDVELFLSTFKGDTNIRDAAIDLTVATLDAVERAIGFFISNEMIRGVKSVSMGGEYEKKLLESLETINMKSLSLMEEANKSHIYESRIYSQETQKMQKQTVNGINSIQQLLADHLAQKDRELEAARQENMYLRVENGILRASSPFQPWSPPPVYSAVPQKYLTQETLRRILDVPDIDISDTAFVSDKAEQLPSRQRVQAEQIIHSQPFKDWIISPSPTKLLIHWDVRAPKVIAGVSPLSLFCTTIRRALSRQERFLSVLWFCGPHIDSADEYVGGHAMLVSLVDQLLRQYAFDTQSLSYEIDIVRIQGRDIQELLKLLGLLVRRLPETITLFLLIDGVGFLEREEFEEIGLPVLASLLSLVGDNSISATVKVLFASTPGTDIVREVFEPEGLIVNVDALPQLSIPANEERMVRELGQEFIEN